MKQAYIVSLAMCAACVLVALAVSPKASAQEEARGPAYLRDITFAFRVPLDDWRISKICFDESHDRIAITLDTPFQLGASVIYESFLDEPQICRCVLSNHEVHSYDLWAMAFVSVDQMVVLGDFPGPGKSMRQDVRLSNLVTKRTTDLTASRPRRLWHGFVKYFGKHRAILCEEAELCPEGKIVQEKTRKPFLVDLQGKELSLEDFPEIAAWYRENTVKGKVIESCLGYDESGAKMRVSRRTEDGEWEVVKTWTVPKPSHYWTDDVCVRRIEGTPYCIIGGRPFGTILTDFAGLEVKLHDYLAIGYDEFRHRVVLRSPPDAGPRKYLLMDLRKYLKANNVSIELP